MIITNIGKNVLLKKIFGIDNSSLSIAIGDGYLDPTEDTTSLANEIARQQVYDYILNENTLSLRAVFDESIICIIREVGLFNTDTNELIAVDRVNDIIKDNTNIVTIIINLVL